MELRARFPEQNWTAGVVILDDGSNLSGDFARGLRKEFAAHKLPISEFFGCCNGVINDVDVFSLAVLRAVDRKKKSQNSHAVSRGSAISIPLVDFLISTILESLGFYKLSPPASFQILLKTHLGIFDSKIVSRQADYQRKKIAAVTLAAGHGELSDREAARQAGVSSTKLNGWMKWDKEFQEWVRHYSAPVLPAASSEIVPKKKPRPKK